MLDNSQPRLEAPVAGMALTHEVGARPWQTPPQQPTIQEAVQHYINKMEDDSVAEQMINILESGVPVTTLANTIQLAGVMEGRHTIDVGMLATPVIMEMIINMAEGAGIEYSTGMERDKDAETEDSRIIAGIEKAREELETMAEADEMPEETTNEVDETTGIMSRRA
tara:strand:- start:589 stop:1089 length:501 start_codon:yes stop_codon:yes gene_type:complete